jgi:hypothetical protein
MSVRLVRTSKGTLAYDGMRMGFKTYQESTPFACAKYNCTRPVHHRYNADTRTVSIRHKKRGLPCPTFRREDGLKHHTLMTAVRCFRRIAIVLERCHRCDTPTHTTRMFSAPLAICTDTLLILYQPDRPYFLEINLSTSARFLQVQSTRVLPNVIYGSTKKRIQCQLADVLALEQSSHIRLYVEMPDAPPGRLKGCTHHSDHVTYPVLFFVQRCSQCDNFFDYVALQHEHETKLPNRFYTHSPYKLTTFAAWQKDSQVFITAHHLSDTQASDLVAFYKPYTVFFNIHGLDHVPSTLHAHNPSSNKCPVCVGIEHAQLPTCIICHTSVGANNTHCQLCDPFLRAIEPVSDPVGEAMAKHGMLDTIDDFVVCGVCKEFVDATACIQSDTAYRSCPGTLVLCRECLTLCADCRAPICALETTRMCTPCWETRNKHTNIGILTLTRQYQHTTDTLDL